jgi:L-lactate dehydrogenase complex protein LldG
VSAGAARAEVDLWATFTAKAELLGAVVIRAASEDAAAAALGAAGAALVATASFAQSFPNIARGLMRVEPGQPAADVVAPAEFAVAETGSVALDEPRLDRGACFLAERLWLVVPADQIVPTLDLAMQRLRDLVRGGSRHPLLMSGPSRTADIERVLTVGVHGPRALTLVIVGQL